MSNTMDIVIKQSGGKTLDAKQHNVPARLNAMFIETEQSAPITKKGAETLISDYQSKRSFAVVMGIRSRSSYQIATNVGGEIKVATAPSRDTFLNLLNRICGLQDRYELPRVVATQIAALDSASPGLIDNGMLTEHYVVDVLPVSGTAWTTAQDKGKAARRNQGRDLIKALGFEIEQHSRNAEMLRVNGGPRAIAVVLSSSEQIDSKAGRLNDLAPLVFGFQEAERAGVDWLVVTHGTRIRVHPVNQGAALSKRSRTETYLEIDLDILPEDRSGYLWLIFSKDALAVEGTLGDLIGKSHEYAVAVAERLRTRVYDNVMPKLGRAIAEHGADAIEEAFGKADGDDLTHAYEVALHVLFRLLFIAYAEDQGLLPHATNSHYRDKSLKTWATRRAKDEEQQDGEASTAWLDMQTLFDAISKSNSSMNVPEYNGALFSSDREVSRHGAVLAQIMLPDHAFAPALEDLVLDKADGQRRAIDFRSLSVREFGTIYEGLLASQLDRARVDLTLDKDGVYKPLDHDDPKQKLKVVAGAVYLHDRSGARKAGGAYYTPHFVVEHLLDKAIEPALDAHLARIASITDDDAAADAFFDFRVSDLAMGSAHFLVAALDRIERRLTTALAERPLVRINNELDDLRLAAMSAMSIKSTDTPDGTPPAMQISDAQLLRRQIARRCLYGIDINEISVQLARLAVWIQSFVPGLPLSFLDHNLVHGNGLIGVSSIEDLRLLTSLGDARQYEASLDNGFLDDVIERVELIAGASESNAKDVRASYARHRAIVSATRPMAMRFDVLVAQKVIGKMAPKERRAWETDNAGEWIAGKMGVKPLEDVMQCQASFGEVDVASPAFTRIHSIAMRLLGCNEALHPLLAWPEVLGPQRGGFDAVLGNPPWEKPKVEEDKFWMRYVPGLKGMEKQQRIDAINALQAKRPELEDELKGEIAEADALRRVLTSGLYPGMGSGDPDLYKAFCWRFHRMLREGGEAGLVLPRSAMSAKGSTAFRLALFDSTARIKVTTVENKGRWVFDIHAQYTVVLTSFRKGTPGNDHIHIHGPFKTRQEFDASNGQEGFILSAAEIRSWNEAAAFPLLPDADSMEIYLQMLRSPRFGDNVPGEWRVRPDTELHSSANKRFYNFDLASAPKGYWPVMKGESFDLWTPDAGDIYANANPADVLQHLQEQRVRSATRSSATTSTHAECGEKWARDVKTLAPKHERIVIRDVTRSTDSRTVKVALIPGERFLTEKAPYLAWPRGDQKDMAYLLGVMSSIPFDWFARRHVETGLKFYILNSIPTPRPGRDSDGWQRVVHNAATLAAIDDRFNSFAKGTGVECGAVDAAAKADMIAEIDAIVAHLYGLTEKQLMHVFDTFHDAKKHETKAPARREAVISHFRAWAGRA